MVRPRPPIITRASLAPLLVSTTASLSRQRIARFLALAVLLLVTAHLLDKPAFHALATPNVYDSDLGRMLRVMGFVPLWALGAIALVLYDWPKKAVGGWGAALNRGALLLGSVAASGVVGELLKLLFRRQRPNAHMGEYVFRPFSERPFHSGGFGLPSTHAVVAFGAAVMLSYLFPRTWIVWWALAVGCALTRVMAGAHFVSDVVAAALVAVVVGAGLWRRWGVPER
jgi:membrane-associated phospholipid phosphatase